MKPDVPPSSLKLSNIEKTFGGVRALRGATLEARRGEILGLCGENGAGKSTLLKVLSGVHPFGSYSGEVMLDGVVQRFSAPADARRAGIAVVYQELTLVPSLSMAQNLLLGREPRRFGLVDEAKLEAIARSQVARFGLAHAIDVTKPVAKLGIGLQQMVEIMRALPQDARVLVLDEPTAALTAREADLLMGWLRALRDRGTTCLYVTHRLDEIFALCDRVTVLRDGRTAATLVTSEASPDDIVRAMVGRRPEANGRRETNSRTVSGPAPAGTSAAKERPPALEVTDLHVMRAGRASGGNGERSARGDVVSGVSFALRRGEILAVCGSMGSGRTALLSSLFGCARAGIAGRIAIDGAAVEIDSPRAAIEHGMAFVPEDRKGAGLVLGMTVAENIALPVLHSRDVMGARAHVGLVDSRAEARVANKRIEALQIRGEAASTVSTLSGGNQQKVVLGKWLERPPSILLLDEPTRGVDVGAREEIHGLLEELARRGVAILFASSDLVEVLRLAHRVLILREGRLVGEIEGAAATQEAIVQLCTAAAPAREAPVQDARVPA